MKKIIECGGLPHIVFMLHSNHVVMQNEAIISLTIMSSTFLQGCNEDELQFSATNEPENKTGATNISDPYIVSSQLHTDAVINGIKNCLNNVDHPKEVKANAATFTMTLLKTKTVEFKQMLKDMNFLKECLNEEALKILPSECKRLHDILNES